MAFLWLKNRDVAEDAVQEVLEKAWANRAMLQKLNYFTGWIVKVVKNQSLQKIHEQTGTKTLGFFRRGRRFQHNSESPPSEQTRSMEWVFRFLKELPGKQQEIFYFLLISGKGNDDHLVIALGGEFDANHCKTGRKQ